MQDTNKHLEARGARPRVYRHQLSASETMVRFNLPQRNLILPSFLVVLRDKV